MVVEKMTLNGKGHYRKRETLDSECRGSPSRYLHLLSLELLASVHITLSTHRRASGKAFCPIWGRFVLNSPPSWAAATLGLIVSLLYPAHFLFTGTYFVKSKYLFKVDNIQREREVSHCRHLRGRKEPALKWTQQCSWFFLT